jgi:hypothetical protein
VLLGCFLVVVVGLKGKGEGFILDVVLSFCRFVLSFVFSF